MLNQTFRAHDLVVLVVLVVLEGLLSIDNAVILGLLARRVAKDRQGRALTYGLIGSFACRLVAIAAAAWLLKWDFVKVIGGSYLLFIAVKHLFFSPPEPPPGADDTGGGRSFWRTVLSIQITDAAFAIDSILAAIALVGPAKTPGIHPKLWVVILGGLIGVALMRVAAGLFIRLLERFPRFEVAGYLLVCVVGLKLLADWVGDAFEGRFSGRVESWLNFDKVTDAGFWLFWAMMAVCFAVGFVPRRATAESPALRAAAKQAG